MKKGRTALVAAVVYAVVSILVVILVSGNGRQPEAAAAPDVVETAEAPARGDTGDPGASFIERYQLPSLERMDAKESRELVSDMQVMKKIELLGLTEQDWLYPQRELAALRGAIIAPRRDGEQRASFTGSKASELNAFMRENAGAVVELSAERIDVDETIVVPDGTALSGDGARLVPASPCAAIRLDHVNNAAVTGLVFEAGFEYGVYAMGCEGVSIEDCVIMGATVKPVVFMGSSRQVVIRRNRLIGGACGGLYVNGDASQVLIEENDVLDNGGTSNWMAGIVLTGIDVQDEANWLAPFGEVVHFPNEQRLETMLKAPHDVIVSKNRVAGNNSTGVYCDGPYRVYIVENRIQDNDKEGLCLDYGTIGAYVSCNDIAGNGNRGRQTDRDLMLDYVDEYGRLADGSACAKLPGVSIDNSAYNIVYGNNIRGNYGGGVKMVRSGLRNIVMTNLLTDDNRGEGDRFHYFAIELGCAAANEDVVNLDYNPAYENIVCRNMITGAHYAGIFLSEGAYINDFFDNTIMDATHWAIECLSDRHNSFVNNHSGIESRGVAAGD